MERSEESRRRSRSRSPRRHSSRDNRRHELEDGGTKRSGYDVKQRKEVKARDDYVSTTSSSDDSSASNHDENKKKKKSKKKRKKRHRYDDNSCSSDSDYDSNEKHHGKRKYKKEKRRKKHKKDYKSKSGDGDRKTGYGAYGIVREENYYTMEPEFLAWASEVKGISTDVTPNTELKKLFMDFAEDYNTATMPSMKYYNIAKWEAETRKKERKLELSKHVEDSKYGEVNLADDEEQVRQFSRSAHAKVALPGQSLQEVLEMRRVERERREQGYRRDLGLKVDSRAGVRTEMGYRPAGGMK